MQFLLIKMTESGKNRTVTYFKPYKIYIKYRSFRGLSSHGTPDPCFIKLHPLLFTGSAPWLLDVIHIPEIKSDYGFNNIHSKGKKNRNRGSWLRQKTGLWGQVNIFINVCKNCDFFLNEVIRVIQHIDGMKKELSQLSFKSGNYKPVPQFEFPPSTWFFKEITSHIGYLQYISLLIRDMKWCCVSDIKKIHVML